MVNWWNVTGLVCDIIGVAGAGLDPFTWTRAAPVDVFPTLPAATRFGFGVPRWAYRHRHAFFWALILLGFIFQLVGQFRR